MNLRQNGVRLLLAVAVGLLASVPGQGGSVTCGTTISGTLTGSVSVSLFPPSITVTVDPCNVAGFQLDLLFDSTTLQVVSSGDLGPFTAGTAPTLIAPGDLQFNGTTATPPPGDVDIFSALFTPFSPSQPLGSESFTVEAVGSDYLTSFNTSTGATTTVGPANITPVTASAPEPSSLILFVSGMVVLIGGWCRLRLRRSIRSHRECGA